MAVLRSRNWTRRDCSRFHPRNSLAEHVAGQGLGLDRHAALAALCLLTSILTFPAGVLGIGFVAFLRLPGYVPPP